MLIELTLQDSLMKDEKILNIVHRPAGRLWGAGDKDVEEQYHGQQAD